MRILISFLFAICLSIGLVGFFSNMVIGTTHYDNIEISDTDEYSMIDISEIEVDNAGNIYFGSGVSGLIQVYNNNNQFLYSVLFDTNGGGYTFSVEPDIIKCIIFRGNKYFEIRNQQVFEEMIVDSEQENALIHDFWGNGKLYYDSDGNEYHISNHKVKMYNAEQLESIISPPQKFLGMVKSVILCFVGVLGIMGCIFFKNNNFRLSDWK